MFFFLSFLLVDGTIYFFFFGVLVQNSMGHSRFHSLVCSLEGKVFVFSEGQGLDVRVVAPCRSGRRERKGQRGGEINDKVEETTGGEDHLHSAFQMQSERNTWRG